MTGLRRRAFIFGPAVALIAMAVCGYAVSSLQPIVNVAPNEESPELGEDHASASLLGQFRTSVSSWLWLRTDLYLHNGTELREMTDAEKHAGFSSERGSDAGHAQLMNEDSVVTTIPSKDRDFRGVFGDIERSTSAYRDMHNHHHRNPQLALPLFRLMTWIDPSFIPGWVEGGAVIDWDNSKSSAMKAVDYIGEGLNANPDSIAILTEIGQLYIRPLGNLPKAVNYLDRARIVGRDNQWSALSDRDRDALEQAYRWLALCYRDLGRRRKMREIAAEGLRVYKDDIVLENLSSPPSMLLKPRRSAN